MDINQLKKSYFKLNWDIGNKHIQCNPWGKQYDTGRGFIVEIVSGGLVITPSTEIINLRWSKPDKTVGYVKSRIENGMHVIDGIDQMYTVAGKVQADIELVVDGVSVSSATFGVDVYPAIAVGAAESTSVFTALQDMLAKIENIESTIQDVVGSQITDTEDKLAVRTEELLNSLNAEIEKRELADTTMTSNYISSIAEVIKEYSYADMISQIDELQSKYSDKLSVKTIGKSALGRDIKSVILGNPNARYKMLVISGHHAKEHQNTPIVLKQIERYCENWDKKFKDEKVSDIFANSAIHYIPSINPDGLEICRIGLDAIPLEDTARREMIKNALVKKMANLSKEADLDPESDLYSQIVWDNSRGYIPNYEFRNEDLVIWKANANGVDLHYNCFEDGYNGEFIRSWASANGWATEPATEGYMGPSGFSEPENQILKSYIEANELNKYIISYHGRGPTMFAFYKQTGEVLQRNEAIAKDLAAEARTPYSDRDNGMVGLTGWLYSKYKNGFYATYETGWSYWPINPDNNYWLSGATIDTCPLKDEQFPHIWESQKDTMLLLLKKYVREQDILVKSLNVSKFDFKASANSDGYFENTVTGIIENWGSTTIPVDQVGTIFTKTITFSKPFTKINFGGFCNLNGLIRETENVTIGIDKKSLDSAIITLVLSKNMDIANRTFLINWSVKGV